MNQEAAVKCLTMYFVTYCGWIAGGQPGTDEERRQRIAAGLLFGLAAANWVFDNADLGEEYE